MKNFFNRITLLIVIIFSISLDVFSQSADNPVELEPGSNKLFVVIGVILIIFIGIILYLFSLDKRIKKIKKNINSNN